MLLTLWMYLLVSLSYSSFIQESQDTCSNEDVACNNHASSTLGSYSGIATLDECRQLCHVDEECKFLTYYYEDGVPFYNFCYLLRSCDDTHDCINCVTETRDCSDTTDPVTCGKNVVGGIGDNFLGSFYDVESEEDCQSYCQSTENCRFYTHYSSSDCILLDSLIKPLQPCDNCVTGPVDCEEYDECNLIVNGESVKHKMFTETNTKIDVNIPITFLGCELKVLIVGGGGRGDSYGAGGGSGYIKYLSKRLVNDTMIDLTVGPSRSPSFVTINTDEHIIANPGQDGNDENGGSGYSGGGAECTEAPYCYGGSNGGNGVDGTEGVGGHGTAEDVTSYKFEYFVLSPGAGGECSYDHFEGGGGGGVIINGQYPPSNKYDGQGYGGGGGGIQYGTYGFQGVILLEIGP